MMFLEFLNKYNDFIFFAHLFFGVTHFSMILFDNLYWDRHNYNSIDNNNTECRLHMKLNSIDDKLHEILIQVSSSKSDSDLDSDPDSDPDPDSDSDSESIIVSETDSNYEFNCNLDNSCNVMTDSTSDSGSNTDSSLNTIDSELDSLTYSESESNLNTNSEQDDNVCVNQDDINEYFKDKVRERQNSRSLSVSGVFSGWY